MLYLTYKWVMAGENQHRYNRVALWLIYIVALTALPAAEWARGFMADAPASVPRPKSILKTLWSASQTKASSSLRRSLCGSRCFCGSISPVWLRRYSRQYGSG